MRRELRRWLRDLHTRTGHTTVFVTHDQDEALEVADRIVVMNKGKIEQIGAPDEVYDDPVSPFVYEFIGELSRFDVEVFSGKPYFEERPVGLPLNSLQDGPQAIYFRPQDTIVEEPKPGLINGVVAPCGARVRRGDWSWRSASTSASSKPKRRTTVLSASANARG